MPGDGTVAVLYGRPGCGVAAPQPLCMINYACLYFACGCDGKVIGGCIGFSQPFAYLFDRNQPTPSGPCDPNKPPSDAGTD